MDAKAFVIGWPIAHSRSPVIHRYWLNALGLAGSYEKIPVEPADLALFIRSLADRGFRGGNVTIPHKEAVATFCDELTPAARRLGAVNTIWLEGSRLHGDSTDGDGLVSALDAEAPGWDDHRRCAMVLGAGGAAKAIVDALQGRGFGRVVVANRTLSRAEALVARLGGEAVALDRATALLREVDCLVNTTAAGMTGSDDLQLDLSALPDHATVNDIVYVPALTGLLRQANARGLRTVGGLGMLLHQAVPGFERWFGERPVVTPDLRRRVEADIAARP